MKKISAFLMSVSLAACLASAENTATSVNIVGFVSKQTSSSVTNKYFMFGGGFLKPASTNERVTLAELLGTNSIPTGSIVYLWNSGSSAYVGETFAGGRWLPGTNLIGRSDGFWFKANSTAIITTSGEVPGSSRTNTVTPILPGYNMLAYPYPVSMPIRDMAFTNCSAVGDIVYKWNPTNGAWVGTTYIGGTTKWTANLVFEPCEGFWYKRTAAGGSTNWIQTSPY